MKHFTTVLATPIAYGLLVEQCELRGIRRTRAFQLARDGLLETFTIGRRRFVMIASLEALPQRLMVAKGGVQ